MKLKPFLDRIKYKHVPRADYDTLSILQQLFVLNIPFENLNIHLGIPLNYSAENVYHKIVTEGRGGLCYENNSLFYEVLKNIGYKVDFINAEMYTGTPLKNSDAFKHMTLLVHIGKESYLVDVGNGKYFGYPLPVHRPEFLIGEDAEYLVDNFEDRKALYYLNPEGQLTPRYVFDLTPRTPAYFKRACEFIQTSKESVFLKGILATRLLPNGRITLTGTKMIRSCGNNKTMETLTPEEFGMALENEFNINLTPDQVEALYEKDALFPVL